MPGVVFSWLYPEHVSGWFASSVASMLWYDANNGRHITGPLGGLIAMSSGPRVAEARCQIVDNFGDKHPDSEWLLMVDSDMVFAENLVEQLMDVADPETTPILGGLCFAGGKFSDPYPTIYRLQQAENGGVGVQREYDYPRNALVRVGATGGACLLIHRGVLVAMRKEFGKLPSGAPNPYPWFQEGVIGPHGEAWGEDILFCLRAHQMGIPVHVHTGIQLGHMKATVLDEEFYDARRASKADAVLPKDRMAGSRENRAQRRARARAIAKERTA